MFNLNADVIKKFIDLISRMSALRMIVFTFCIIIVGTLFMTSSNSWTSYVDSRLTSSQQNEVFKPATYNLSPQNLSSINSTITGFIQQNNDVAMVLVYKLVPKNDTFYQGRVLVTGISNKNTNLDIEKYNLHWLPISAFRAQSNMILKGKIFIGDLNVINHDYLQPDNELRDEYLTPGNISAMYNDGAKYMISVPVNSNRIEGYVSVFFKSVPENEEKAEQYLNLAKSITGTAGYYISF